MALFQCIQVSKGTTPDHQKGLPGIWRSRAFWGLTPKSNRAMSRCDVEASKCHLWLQRPLETQEPTKVVWVSAFVFAFSVFGGNYTNLQNRV